MPVTLGQMLNPIPEVTTCSAIGGFWKGRSASSPELFDPHDPGISTRAHVGLDLTPRDANGRPRKGVPIQNVLEGVVAHAGYWTSSAGNGVIVRHAVLQPDNTLRTLYSKHFHCPNSFPVHKGQVVKAGQVIGYTGDTGDPAPGAYHDHFELVWDVIAAKWYEYKHLNPEVWIWEGYMLRRGDNGLSVRKLQHRLNELGATPKLTEDGDFGPGTEAAVKAFQHKEALDETGWADAITTAIMFSPARLHE